MKYVKKQFPIIGYRTGGRLQGQDGQYFYMVTDGKCHTLADHFTSKRAASAWLGEYVRKLNNGGE